MDAPGQQSVLASYRQTPSVGNTAAVLDGPEGLMWHGTPANPGPSHDRQTAGRAALIRGERDRGRLLRRALSQGRPLDRHSAPQSAVAPWAAAWWNLMHPEAARLVGAVRPGAVCLVVGGACDICTGALSVLAGTGGQVHCLDSPDRPARWSAMASTLGGADVVVHRSTDGVDAVCAQAELPKVDFIKADVRKAPPGLLLDAFVTLLRDRPALLLRIGPGGPVRRGRCEPDIVSSLTRSLAYEVYRWQGGDWRPVTSAVRDEGKYLFKTCEIPTGPL
ncbi:hypothetical protein [Streptomyces sp. NPDC057494]|uniref:hypothetical protein n=1 Tax=Streptomyces sp. NPDC057494 TaxID=3346148 RepID=UPI00369A2BC3